MESVADFRVSLRNGGPDDARRADAEGTAIRAACTWYQFAQVATGQCRAGLGQVVGVELIGNSWAVRYKSFYDPG